MFSNAVGAKKLNFNDVLLIPQKSYIQSRSQVDIGCEYKFRHSTHTWKGTPIISSNMDTVTNVNTATLLAEHGWISVFPKHFNQEWLAAKELPGILNKTNNYALSCGTGQ